jgi:hypothetical protein
MMERRQDLIRFYDLLDELEGRLGGKRVLSECDGRMGWPQRGIYFFFETGEARSDTGAGPRVTRVGTHALAARSSSKLWTRLSQHRGQARSGGGNHRGSIFRLLVGAAMLKRDGVTEPKSWGLKRDALAAALQTGLTRAQLKEAELAHEIAVSEYIGAMPFLWLGINDAPGPDSDRGLIERNAIALLSNYGKDPCDPPSDNWLGHNSDRERVRRSGMWNNNHVDEDYDPGFLAVVEKHVLATKA